MLTEHLYKRTAEVPLHKQNALLYSCGVAFNALAFLFVAPSAAAAAGASDGFFHDYTHWTVLVIFSQGISGYLVGALFKYIDAIAAIYADLAAMLCTTMFSAVFFDLQVNFLFVAGFLASSASIWIYYGGQADSRESGHEAESEQRIAMAMVPMGGSERGTGLVEQGFNAVENVANRLRRERSARRLGRSGSGGGGGYHAVPGAESAESVVGDSEDDDMAGGFVITDSEDDDDDDGGMDHVAMEEAARAAQQRAAMWGDKDSCSGGSGDLGESLGE